MILDFMETDLHKIIYSKNELTDEHIQYFVYQILKGRTINNVVSAARSLAVAARASIREQVSVDDDDDDDATSPADCQGFALERRDRRAFFGGG